MDGEHSQEYGMELDIQVLLVDLLRSAWKFLWVEVILVLLCAGVMCFKTHQSYFPQYRAEASFTVYVTNPLQSGIQSYNSATAEQMAKTFPYILTSGALSDLVREELGVAAIPAISASTVENTNIFTLSVTASDPQFAYDVLKTVITHYPEVAEYVVGPTQMSLLDESGVPTQPINQPDYLHTALRGAVVGTVVWLAIVFLIAVSRSTVHNEKQLKQMMNLPCLGLLPKAKGYGKGRKAQYPVMIHDDELLGFAESVRLLRLRVEKELKKREKKVLLVSSAIPGEGISCVAAFLGFALARWGLLSLAEYLQGKASEKEIFQRPIEEIQLVVVYGGKSTGEAAELLSRQEAMEFVDTAKEEFDYIIIDTPPCSMMADAMEAAVMADCALLTIRQDYAPKDRILEGAQNLAESGLDVIGCALNGVEKHVMSGSYGYRSYGYHDQGAYKSYGDVLAKKK